MTIKYICIYFKKVLVIFAPWFFIKSSQTISYKLILFTSVHESISHMLGWKTSFAFRRGYLHPPKTSKLSHDKLYVNLKGNLYKNTWQINFSFKWLWNTFEYILKILLVIFSPWFCIKSSQIISYKLILFTSVHENISHVFLEGKLTSCCWCWLYSFSI